MCKKFKFDHTNKWYLYNPAPVQENDTHKLLWDFDGQTDHVISTRTPNLRIINKKKRTCKIVDFAVPADPRKILKESENKDKYLDLARKLKKVVEHEGDNYTNWDWCLWIIKETGELRSWWPRGDHTNDSIIENGQNTEKSPGDLRRLAVPKTPVKDHQR